MQKILIGLMLASLPMECISQVTTDQVDTGKVYIITMKDGSIINGSVTEKTSEEIVVKTKNIGTIRIEFSNIRKAEHVSKENFRNGEYWFENPNSTRYFVGPTGIPLKKGEGYYQNIYAVVQSFNIGITKNFSIGCGFEIITLFLSNNSKFNFALLPKAGFKLTPKIHAGAGILYINLAKMFDYYYNPKSSRDHYGIGYGIITFGTLDNNFTLGTGWWGESVTNQVVTYDPNSPYTQPVYSYKKSSTINSSPIITFSGAARAGKRFSLISENWIIPVNQTDTSPVTGAQAKSVKYKGFISYGFRIFGDKTSFDLGFVNNSDIASVIFIGIPYVDFVVKFGK